MIAGGVRDIGRPLPVAGQEVLPSGDAQTPPRGGRLPAIDALRGVAALAVLVSHLPFSATMRPARASDAALTRSVFPAWLDGICHLGQHGVHLFLVISGFCIHMAWARQGDRDAVIDFRKFWRRRLHRLYPPYLATLALSVAGLWVLHSVIGGVDGSIANQLGYADASLLLFDLALLLLLAQNITRASDRIGNGPFWTLALEEQLYALYFPLLWMRRRWNWSVALVVVLLATVAWRVTALFAFPDAPTLIRLGPARWLEWALGAVAVEAYLGRIRLPAWTCSVPLGVAGLASCFMFRLLDVGWMRLPSEAIIDAAIGLSLFMLVNAACARDWAGAGAGLVTRFLSWVGAFSYSLYLTHQLVIVATKQLAMRVGLPIVAIAAARIVVPIIAGLVFYVLVERRFIKASRRASGSTAAPA